MSRFAESLGRLDRAVRQSSIQSLLMVHDPLEAITARARELVRSHSRWRPRTPAFQVLFTEAA